MTRAEYEKLNVDDPVKGKKAMDEANDALSPIANKEFKSTKKLVEAWDAKVRPVADKYGVEISSKE